MCCFVKTIRCLYFFLAFLLISLMTVSCESLSSMFQIEKEPDPEQTELREKERLLPYDLPVWYDPKQTVRIEKNLVIATVSSIASDTSGARLIAIRGMHEAEQHILTLVLDDLEMDDLLFDKPYSNSFSPVSESEVILQYQEQVLLFQKRSYSLPDLVAWIEKMIDGTDH